MPLFRVTITKQFRRKLEDDTYDSVERVLYNGEVVAADANTALFLAGSKPSVKTVDEETYSNGVTTKVTQL